MTEDLFGLSANLIDAFALCVGKTGKILNARGIRLCFLIDMGCLVYWIHMDFQRGLYSQGVSAMISFCIAGYGYRKWGKKSPV